MLCSGFAFPEETQLGTDCATFFHYAEYGIYLTEHLRAGNCQAILVVVIEILIKRHPVGE